MPTMRNHARKLPRIAGRLRALAWISVSVFPLLVAGCLPSAGSSGSATTLTVGPALPSGAYGEIQIGSTVRSAIVGASFARNIYHEYVVPVPVGVESVTIELDGLGRDVDLAVTIGGPLVDFDEAYHFDRSVATVHRTSVASTAFSSAERILYLYVLNLVIDQPADYVLSVTGVGSPVPDSQARQPEPIRLAEQIRDVVARDMGGLSYDCFEGFPCFLLSTGQADAQARVEGTLAAFTDVVPVDASWDRGEGGYVVRAYKLAMDTGETNVFDVYVDGGVAAGQGTVVAFSVLWTVDAQGGITYYD